MTKFGKNATSMKSTIKNVHKIRKSFQKKQNACSLQNSFKI